jgi:hypothetical protein
MTGRLWQAVLAGLAVLTMASGPALAAKTKPLPTVAEKTEGFEKIDGLFPLYRDEEDGDLYMEIAGDQIGEEFIAFSYTENGVLDAGTFKGAYRDNRIVRFDKHYGRLELSVVNTAFYFDPENPISRAADANIAPSIIGSLGIVAETKASESKPARYLIAADPVFRSEMLSPIAPLPNPASSAYAFELGSLSGSKTKYDTIRGYPDNIDLVVDYVFDNPMPYNQGSAAVTDARSVTLKVQHSLIAMPDEGFEPRFDDYRVGYFLNYATDLTSFEAAPYRDVIQRWRLEKKDPEAALSEPVKPITFWIENTTPHEYRPVIEEAVLAWNEAFEEAGFKNAVEVKTQPDDAQWDAGDIRYNVLRWTSSPNPPFGGYGPRFTNPRTGEILGADIMLELASLKSNLLISSTFGGETPEALAEGLGINEAELCMAGRAMREKLAFSHAALDAMGAPEAERQELSRQSLMTLIMHEVGHTLGLSHNMKATHLFDAESIHDKEQTRGAPSASVMDYHAANIAPPGMEQGDYEHSRVGPYDRWAISFGYMPEAAEADMRERLLARASEPALTFGNDADDMRYPGKGIDPRVMLFDHSADPVGYAMDRFDLVRSVRTALLDRAKTDATYQGLLQRYYMTLGEQSRMADAVARQIGGIHVERRPPSEGASPFTPVPLSEQKRAMRALADHVFAADAFLEDEGLLAALQPQRRGQSHWGGSEDPKPHSWAIYIQMDVLNHVLHPATLQRMTNSALYGNGYNVAELIQDLNDAIYGNDLIGAPNTFRRNLQVAYTRRLVSMAYGAGYDPIAQAAALAGVEDVRSRFGFVPDFLLPLETRAHRAAIRHELGWLD